LARLYSGITRADVHGAEQMDMWIKHPIRHDTEAETPFVYVLIVLMWAVFFFAFYLLWQKAAN
jgi:hypothetical protein